MDIYKSRNVVSIGKQHPNGTYLLRINLEKDTELVFGKFKRGKIIRLKKGHYIYIGSALAKKGSTTLGNRLRRHTSRSADKKPHKIQSELLTFFDEIGIHYTKTPSPKKMKWNIDHLLNLEFAEIVNIIFIRQSNPLENTWSEYLEGRDETSIFEKGLGANDSKGHTHVQAANFSDEQWNELPFLLPKEI